MWGWQRQHGDDMGMTWWRQGRCGDHGDNMGWRPRRPQPWGPHGDLLEAMEMMWGQWGWHGDDVGTTGMTWEPRGQCGDHGDNEITKNTITFEWIEIIEFHLKIWDPWTLPHTCRLQLMCRWGVLSQVAFLSKKCSGDPQKKISCFCTGSH